MHATTPQLQAFFNEHKPKSTPGILTLALQQIEKRQMPNGLALDLCCGTGTLSRQLAERGYQVVGLDISSAFIGRGSQNTPDAHFVVADLGGKLPLADHGAQLVCCIDSFQYFGDPALTLREIGRVLQPGGWFVFSSQNGWNPAGIKRTLIERSTGRPWSPWLTHPVENHVTAPWLRKALTENGFRIDYVHGLQMLNAWVALLPGPLRRWSPIRSRPWLSLASIGQRMRFGAAIEQSPLGMTGLIIFICAQKIG